MTVRASEARGHCSRIDALYRGTLRPWFLDRLSRDQMTTLDQSFSALGHSDIDMSYAIEKLANWLSEKASATLTLIDKGDTEGARREIKDARIEASDLRRKLTATVSQMRGIQADLIMAAG